jgi:succinyl-CoA synthetase alpha subunit
MGIILDSKTRVLVQGITGTQGSFHTKLMLDYRTKVAAGTSPGKGGMEIHGIPVYDTIDEAKKRHDFEASIIFVPAPFVKDAVLEALDNQIKTVVVISEHVPVKDTIYFLDYARRVGSIIVGPNTPGVIVPGECKLGIMPSQVFAKGKVGLVSRSGTLTYEIANGLTNKNIGQSTCFGIGGDPVTGLNFVDALRMFRDDSETEAVALIGEIGGTSEESAAEYIVREGYPKPVVAYVVGLSAPPHKRMGHAGAIVSGKAGTAKSKIEAFKKAGVQVAKKPSDVARILNQTSTR